MAARKSRGQKPGGPRPAFLEWLVALTGLLLVLASLAVLASDLFVRAEPVVDLSFRTETVELRGGVWSVAVEVSNHGRQTAADLTIEGRAGGETREFTLDYLPAHGRARGVLYFDARPDVRGLIVRPVSWVEP